MSRWYVLCDVCGEKLYNTETIKRWDGMRVCMADYERKHPLLDYRYKVKGGEGQIPSGQIGFTGHEDTSQSVLVCDIYTSMGVVGYGTTGCARTGTYARIDLPPLPGSLVPPVIFDPSGDPFFGNVALLMNFNTFKDESSFNRSFVQRDSNHLASISAGPVPGTGSLDIHHGVVNNFTCGIQASVRDSVVFPNTVTVEFWLKGPTSLFSASYPSFYDEINSPVFRNVFTTGFFASQLFQVTNIGAAPTAPFTYDNNWHFYAYTFVSSGPIQTDYRVYVDGVLVKTSTSSGIKSNVKPFWLFYTGQEPTQNIVDIDSLCGPVRITYNVLRYTGSTCPVPTGPFPNYAA